MNPGKIAGANHSFGAPPNWDAARDGECCTLPVLNTGAMLQSAWYPSPEEIEALRQGCPVILNIYGRQHPVVSLGVAPVPSAAEMMCQHGKTVADGCAACENATLPDNLAAPRIVVPPPRKKQ